MKNLKKIAVGLSTAALVLGSVVPALAAADAVNTDITDHSYANSQAQDVDNMTEVNTNSVVDFDNVDVAVANTGLNFEIDNEDNNTMTTSGAMADWGTANFANVNETEFGESSGAHASNARVSDHSGDLAGGAPAGPVYAYADDGDNFTVVNTNLDTDLFNVTVSVANTGLNFQIGNEDLNAMTTGDASSGAYVANVVNNNYTVIGSSGGSAEASNEDITDHSYAEARAYDNDTVGVTNTNSGTNVENWTVSVANSGLNFQIDNEDSNTIATGDVEATAETANYVNVNETIVDTGSSADASNDNVDDHSSAVAVATDNDTVNVTNTNLNTTVNNVSVSVANSGGNGQIGNEDGNSIVTGAAVASGTTSNVVNGNQTYVGPTPTP